MIKNPEEVANMSRPSFRNIGYSSSDFFVRFLKLQGNGRSEKKLNWEWVAKDIFFQLKFLFLEIIADLHAIIGNRDPLYTFLCTPQ